MYVCLYVCMDGWMDGWLDGCMNTYVCMHVRMHVCIYRESKSERAGSMHVCMCACVRACKRTLSLPLGLFHSRSALSRFHLGIHFSLRAEKPAPAWITQHFVTCVCAQKGIHPNTLPRVCFTYRMVTMKYIQSNTKIRSHGLTLADTLLAPALTTRIAAAILGFAVAPLARHLSMSSVTAA